MYTISRHDVAKFITSGDAARRTDTAISGTECRVQRHSLSVEGKMEFSANGARVSEYPSGGENEL